jgi:hypothetical protein
MVGSADSEALTPVRRGTPIGKTCGVFRVR